MGQGSDRIDWSKAGTRLRRTEPKPSDGGRNPDWNWVQKRWKVAEEYAAETLTTGEVADKVACPREGCVKPAGTACVDARDNPMPGSPHVERRFAAGAALIAEGWTL